jgi:hypothetical protein
MGKEEETPEQQLINVLFGRELIIIEDIMDGKEPKSARESRRRRRRQDREAVEEDLGSVFDGVHTQQFECMCLPHPMQ